MRIYIVKLKTLIISAITVIALTALFFIPRTITVFNSTDGRNLPVYRVGRDDSKISLTFDCAWNDDDIESILDTLDNYNVTAAFFVTGDWADKYGDSLEKIRSAGHIIGNHSYNHLDYTKLTANEIRSDIDKADASINNACGAVTKYMRTPSGAYNDTAINAVESMNKICVQWSVDSLDYKDGVSEDTILSRLGKTKSGDIILMHNGTELTAQLLPKIIKGLEKKFEFVSLDELIYSENFTINHAGEQFLVE